MCKRVSYHCNFLYRCKFRCIICVEQYKLLQDVRLTSLRFKLTVSHLSNLLQALFKRALVFLYRITVSHCQFFHIYNVKTALAYLYSFSLVLNNRYKCLTNIFPPIPIIPLSSFGIEMRRSKGLTLNGNKPICWNIFMKDLKLQYKHELI